MGRTGLVCAVCPDGKVLADGKCEECKGVDRLLLMLILIACIGALNFAYFLNNDKLLADASNALALSIVFGMVVTSLQLLAPFNQLELGWSGAAKSILGGSTFIIFDPSSLSSECVFGTDPTVRYAMRVIVPYATVCFLLLFGAVSQIFR